MKTDENSSVMLRSLPSQAEEKSSGRLTALTVLEQKRVGHLSFSQDWVNIHGSLC